MSQPVVLITFYSRCGATEKRALAAAVGAVQARALIRLRRLPDRTPPPADESAGCRAHRERMEREYVAPTEADLRGADAIVIGLPAGSGPDSAEWVEYRRLLELVGGQGGLKGKVGAALAPAPGFLGEAVAGLGLVAETGDDATLLGRAVAERVRTRH